VLSAINTIKRIPRRSIYKILDIVAYNGLVWQILVKYISITFVRFVYLRELLIAVMLWGDIKNGYSVRKCEDCGFEHKVGFRCGKRFCNKCGYRHTENCVRKSKSKVLNVGHRHIIVTIPELL
jgi:hypothetical protein